MQLTNSTPTSPLYHIGEVILVYCSPPLRIQGTVFKVKPRMIFGTKAYHLSNQGCNKYKAFFKNYVSEILTALVLLSFGEIDCRKEEGILVFHAKTDLKLQEIIKHTILNYVDFVWEQFAPKKCKVYFMDVPPPYFTCEQGKNLDNLSLLELR